MVISRPSRDGIATVLLVPRAGADPGYDCYSSCASDPYFDNCMAACCGGQCVLLFTPGSQEYTDCMALCLQAKGGCSSDYCNKKEAPQCLQATVPCFFPQDGGTRCRVKDSPPGFDCTGCWCQDPPAG